MAETAPTLIVLQPGPFVRLLRLFRLTFVAAYEDNCFGTAKGAAYSALLSFFPVLTTITALLVQANAAAVSRVMSRILFEVAPPGTQDLLQVYFIEQGKRPVTLLVVATLVSVWAASGVMMSLMEGFQAAYRIPSGRGFVKQRAVAAVLVVCAAVPLVAGSALILIGSRFEAWIGVAGWFLPIGRALRTSAAFVSIVVAASVLYTIGPNRRIRFRVVWPGACLATILWFLATVGFGWYVRNIAHYNVLYGSIAAAIALLVWMYVLAVIALIGCEFNAVRERAAGE